MANDRLNSPIIRPALMGNGPAPTVAVGNATQLGTGPTASLVGTGIGLELTITPGTAPAAFVANTPVVLATITLPSPLFQNAPFVGVTSSNQTMAQLEAGGLTAATQAMCVYVDRAASTSTSLVLKAVSQGTPTFAASTPLKLLLDLCG